MLLEAREKEKEETKRKKRCNIRWNTTQFPLDFFVIKETSRFCADVSDRKPEPNMPDCSVGALSNMKGYRRD